MDSDSSIEGESSKGAREERSRVPRAIYGSLLFFAIILSYHIPKAYADDCVALGGNIVGGECQIAAAQVKAGAFNLDETLHILSSGSITVPSAVGGNFLSLNITGDLIMDVGSDIVGNATGGGGVGATITVNATRDIILRGLGSSGARITADQIAGSCTTGRGGNITLAADADGNLDGDAVVEKGAVVSANARCSGGEIIISGVDVDIDGLVESRSNASGTGGGLRPGGGPITIDALCDLTVTGTVSSRGIDPGAGLVHLEGGCVVRILGLVEATGSGHGIPTNPPTLCSVRPGKPANTTACVEVFAGDLLIIDSTAPNRGEINADTGGPGGSAGTSFIDLFARGNITIIGDSAGPFAVHANGLGSSNDDGGDITVQSVAGEVSASGRALQADALRPGGDGGTLIVEADEDVTLDTASLHARGDFNPTGGLGLGGAIATRSFNGTLSWQNGDGDVRPSTTGTIALTACGAVTPTGTDFHGVAPTISTGLCGGAPTLPSYVVLPDCLCPGPGPGLPPPPFACAKATTSSVLDPNSGRFPGNNGPDAVVQGHLGQSIQTAIDTATDSNGDSYIIIGVVGNSGPLGGELTQSIVIDHTFTLPFALIACSVTLRDPTPGDGNPTARITAAASSPDLFIMDLHATDSDVAGWLVEGDNRFLRNVRALNNGVGIWIIGNGNAQHNGTVTGNGIGILVQGNTNTISDNDVLTSGGDGINITGNGNLLVKNDVGISGKGNGGDGIQVSGAGNTLSENDTFANGENGILVSGGVNNLLRKNQSGGASGKNNGDCEFDLVAGSLDGSENKANGVMVNLVIPGCTGTP